MSLLSAALAVAYGFAIGILVPLIILDTISFTWKIVKSLWVFGLAFIILGTTYWLQIAHADVFTFLSYIFCAAIFASWLYRIIRNRKQVAENVKKEWRKDWLVYVILGTAILAMLIFAISQIIGRGK